MAVAMSTDTAPVAGANDTSVGEPVTPAGATPRGPVTSASYSITVRLTAIVSPLGGGRFHRPP